MIESVWPYLAVMLLAAGFWPAIERRFGWKLFNVLPPIVLTYITVTALSVGGLWQATPAIHEAQSTLVARGVPALIFLLMIGCDLRAILALGGRVLGVFVCTSISLFIAFVSAYLIFRHWIPGDGWMPLASLSGSWVGGTANLIAVKQAIGMSDTALATALLTDAICYSLWVVVLFAIAPLAPAFNRWTRAISSADMQVAEQTKRAPATPDSVLLWLGLALLVGALAATGSSLLPVGSLVSSTTWTILLTTVAGLVVAQTPLARLPGAQPVSSALLIAVVAVLASQSSFAGIAAAPVYLLCGVTIIAIHALLLCVAARVFHFDLYLCGISSLAHIGGVAATPVLAATYSRSLVPVGILLALLGYILGTGFGLVVAAVLSKLAS